VILLRGINVGGKNKLSMAALKECLDELGYENVKTYINSGNVIADSPKGAAAVEAEIEAVLPGKFKLDSELIRVLALPKATFKAMVEGRPKGFGDEPGKYHSDAIFLMRDIKVKDAFAVFEPREGVDVVWPGKGVIYSQRLSAQRSACLLLYKEPLSETAKARLETIRGTEDGFVIAERDLDLRGQGDLLGTRQSGMPGYNLAVPDVHRHLLEYAHDDARAILKDNPGLTGPHGEAVRTLLYLFRKDLALPLIRAG
jgi:uncharacterized protein (DUF1697 family)